MKTNLVAAVGLLHLKKGLWKGTQNFIKDSQLSPVLCSSGRREVDRAASRSEEAEDSREVAIARRIVYSSGKIRGCYISLPPQPSRAFFPNFVVFSIGLC